MQEGAVMEYVKWFIALFFLVGMVAIVLFFLDINGANSFKQQVNYHIERNGGLTEEAIYTINNLSDEHYKGMFRIESDQMYEKVSYGEIVDYTVVATIPISIFPFPDQTIKLQGSGISQIR